MKTLLFLLLTAPLALAEFSIKETPGKHIDVLGPDGKPVSRIMTAHDVATKESRLETYKVYTHIFDREGAAPITKGAGGLFPHHRGIFLGWSKTKFGGKGIDSWHMKGCVQVYQKILSQETSDSSAKINTLIHWQTDAGEVFLEEQRTQTFTLIEGGGDYLQVDFHSELSAPLADVELNGDPEHAGFQFRPSQEVATNKSAKYLFHKDGLNLKKDKDLPWVAESFQTGGKQYFVQYICAPSNPKGNTYSAYRDYGRFGAYFVHTINKGETLKLDYRITIGEGELPSREAFEKRFAAYTR
jgi:hypothetical protein